jgi:hypothetical protein
MYNSTSINDGLQFINQSSTRINKTCNKLKNNKYKNNNNKELILDNDDEIIENFVVDDTAITIKNTNETNKMNTNIVGYNTSMTDLNSIQNSITKQSKIFLDINKKSDDSSLRNKDVQIKNGSFGRVNNAGLLKLYPAGVAKCGIPTVPKSVGFDLSGKSAADYSVLEDAAGNLALYGTDMVSGPSGVYPCSDYAGTNIYVSKPIDFNYDTNMVYVGVYDQNAANSATIAGQLTAQNDLSNSTVKQCVTRAMDKGLSFASLSNYNSNSKTGQCYVGNYLLNGGSSNGYRTIQRATIFTIPNTSHDAFTFAADGGLYSGTSGTGGNLFLSPLITATGSTKVPVGILSPQYGATINELTASYAYESGWGNWDDIVRFNPSPVGTPGGRLDTARQYSYWYPIMRTYSYQYEGRTYSYQQQDWEIRTHTDTVTWQGSGLVYIRYRCGKKDMTPTSTRINLGEGFSIGCWELYEQYPSFSLNLSDDGTVTIVNNKTPNDILYTNTNQISNQPETQMISIAGANKTMMPWADRPDWVSGSVNGGGLLTAYSMGSKTLTNGQYISSPLGKCRLIFYKSGGNAGTLVLEYSVYNVSQTQGTASSQGVDKDNNLIGNSNNYSQYYLTKVDDANIKSKIAYIDINNGLHEYPRDMTLFDNDYIEMKNFVPNPLNGTTIPNTTEALCKTACNDDALCAGYTYNSSVCKKYRDTEIYPKGDRILDEGKTTYIRKKKISTTNSTHFSCNKFVHNVDSGVYSSYPKTDPNPMTTTQKCALGLILDPRMGVLETKNSAAVRKGDEIKGYINSIYTNQNKLKDTINTKSKDIEKGIAGQEAVKKQIDKYEESNITSTATVSDTELLLVSDNYQYVLWSIVTVIVGIAAIKTFRGAAE